MKKRVSKFKAAVIGLVALFSVGCAETWTEAPKALDPVSQNLFPVAGDTLIALSDSFKALCHDERAATTACQRAKQTLNKAIDAYNRANDLILESY